MKKLFTIVAAALMSIGANAQDVVEVPSPFVETKATLVHTAASFKDSREAADPYVSDIDAEKEHINNGSMTAGGAWMGCAYADFAFEIPEDEVFYSATLTWKGVGSGKNRTTDVFYVNDPSTVDYSDETGFGSGNALIDLNATFIQTVTFPANTTTTFETDVTDAVKAMINGGYKNLVFKFTNNVGAGDLVGKGSAEGYPELLIVTKKGYVYLFHTAASFKDSREAADPYVSDIDAQTEHINNGSMTAGGAWMGCAYADFGFYIPEGLTLTNATLTWKGVGSGKNRTTDVFYVNDPSTVDYSDETGFGSGNALIDLDATFIQTVTFPANTTTTFETDVTDAVKAMINSGCKNVVFKFTNNVGAGDLVGKGSAEGYPELVFTTTAAATSNYYVARMLEDGTPIDTVKYDGVVIGTEAYANDDDMADFTKDGVKFTYVSGVENGVVVSEVEEENYIRISFREADKASWVVAASTDRLLSDGTGYVGDQLNYGYPKYISDNLGNLYVSDRQSGNPHWGGSVNLTENGAVVEIPYTQVDGVENVVLCEEGENIAGLTHVTSSNSGIRSSNCNAAYAENISEIGSLEPGVYELHVGLFDATSSLGKVFNFFLDAEGNEKVATFTTSVVNFEEPAPVTFNVKEASTLFVQGGSVNTGLDFLYIVRKGDYNYLDVNSWLPDTITYTKGDPDMPQLSDYYTYESSQKDQSKFAATMYLAKVEPGTEKADVDYTAYNDEMSVKMAFVQGGVGTYYAFGTVTVEYDNSETETISTDTIVIVIKEKEETIDEPSAHTWDFTKFSEATVTNLKADAAASKTEGWSDVEKKADAEDDKDPTDLSRDNCFWFAGAANADGALEADGIEIEELAGLYFHNSTYNSARSIAIAVNYGSVDTSKDFGPYSGASYLWLGGKNGGFTIKNVKPNSTITMGVESHKITDARGVKLTLDEQTLNDPEGNAVNAPTTYAVQTWQVPSNEANTAVDIVVTNTNGCHIYWIDAEIDETATAIDAVSEEAQEDGVKKIFENGKLVILNGAAKYNAAGAQVK